MTMAERLAAWRAAGTIDDRQYATLGDLVLRRRVSVYLELSALLYLGVLAFVGGLAWTLRAYVADLGDAAIVAGLTAIVAAAFGYCFVRAGPYTPAAVESGGLSVDYVLYLGCLTLAAEAGFLEYRFEVFRDWHHHLLLGAVIFGGLAYRFDNRFVLSLALSSLAGWLGVGLAGAAFATSHLVRITAVAYGGVVAGAGLWLARRGVKAHFLDAYLHVAAHVALASMASGLADGAAGSAYLGALVALAGAAIVFGIRSGRFAFVAYGVLYGYGGVTLRLLERFASPTAALLYVAVTGSLVLIGLVVVARRFGREE